MARKPEGNLKKGWTTGACASAAARAAFSFLITGNFENPVTIILPNGQKPTFKLSRQSSGYNWAEAGIIKDAGDDPDVTHGAEVIVRVARGVIGQGIQFHAGEGIGTVTLPGLPLSVGEPAINPGPRQMISENLCEALSNTAKPDLDITISIPGGNKLALKTMNGRLGIKGGLSVLGTTGIVVPFSCASWIDSIHRGVDVALAQGILHIAAATGSTSESAIKKMFNLSEQALIDMGDFAGGLLKYLRRKPVERLTLVGGFGKLTKLAQGHLDLHSGRSSVDMRGLAEIARRAGGSQNTVKRIAGGNTALEALNIAKEDNLKIANSIAAMARGTALATLAGDMEVDVIVFDREGKLIGHASGDASAPK
ncbi:MAG: cobalt-precorrin-5B (C(1))-methyltransferase [Rhodospirillaceae bacterium TMED8]|nr:cobalt-precorrin-5B (C(1))-methyltransferase [Magnetovibrio sp.]OUT47869.1 MAG: cobalt-precorrin-5B (C(1))-methyltransferase [Rhodospirillaceae bacterium TMED8]